MSGLVVISGESERYILIFPLWLGFTLHQYYREIKDMEFIDAIDHVKHRSLEN